MLNVNDGYQSILESQYVYEVHVAADHAGDPIQDVAFSGPQPVEALVDYALSNHPAIAAVQYEVISAEERIRSANMPTDPRLAVTSGVSPVETAAGPQDISLSVSQELSFPSKTNGRVALAEAERDQAAAKLEQVRQRQAAKVRLAYSDLFEASWTLRLLLSQKELLETVETLAETRSQVDLSNQQRWRDATIQVDIIELKIIDQQRKVETARQDLAEATGLDPQTRVEPLENLPEVFLDDQSDVYVQLANEFHPELQTSFANMRAAQIRLELECLSRTPDPTISASWIGVGSQGLSPVANGRDSVLVGVSMGLPIFRSRDLADARAVSADAASVVQTHRSLKLAIQANTRNHYSAVRTHLAHLELLEGQTIRTAEEVVRSSIEQYQVDQIRYEELSGYRERLYHLEQERIRATTSAYQSFVRLIESTGGRVPMSEEEFSRQSTNANAHPSFNVPMTPIQP